MKTNNYQRCKIVLANLKTEIHRIAASGEDYLPGERELSNRLGASRVTLRKVLKVVESDGLVQTLGRKRKITDKSGDYSACGQIVFLSSGVNGVFTMNAMERIWNALHIPLLQGKANVKLLLTDLTDTTGTVICNELDHADIILYAGGSGAGYDYKIKGHLNQLNQDKRIISLIQSSIFPGSDYITLDNYTVGAMAAEKLLTAGARRPFALWQICNTQDFAGRAQGFADALAKTKCGGIQSVFWVAHEDGAKSNNCRALIDWAVKQGYDAAFIMSDEHIGEIIGSLYTRNLVPDKFKLITVDGTQEAFRHDPPVSCITHSSQKVAQTVLEQLRKITHNNYEPTQILIPPGFSDNGSL